jgi:hypothetical protein
MERHSTAKVPANCAGVAARRLARELLKFLCVSIFTEIADG